ncbi:sodium ion-translocating decarboxylase subunit beta, partial [Arthrospira platensis SPKY1]|nr:sodium ion-translocating decarboxylase subunit beta [Arthrospira platensis SPKY1]
MDQLQNLLLHLGETTGFDNLTWQMLAMWVVVGVLLYLAVAKNFEPLLLVPIAFGALLANLPTEGIMEGLGGTGPKEDGSFGLFYYFYQG